MLLLRPAALTPAASLLHSLDVALYRRARFLVMGRPVERWLLTYSKVVYRVTLGMSILSPALRAAQSRLGSGLHPSGAIALAWLASKLTKKAVKRSRPVLPECPPRSTGRDDLSFPSSDAAVSFAGAESLRSPELRLPFYALATAIAVARV